MKDLIEDLKNLIKEENEARRKLNQAEKKLYECREAIKIKLYGLDNIHSDKYILAEGQHNYDIDGVILCIKVDEGEILSVEPFSAIKITTQNSKSETPNS